jgi:pyruvate ferredoxin oxidoreductase gamma subunit
LLGALTALSGVLRLDSVITAINDKFSGDIAAGNIAVARAAHAAAHTA